MDFIEENGSTVTSFILIVILIVIPIPIPIPIHNVITVFLLYVLLSS